MGLRYENLSGETRRLMTEEIVSDEVTAGLYTSSYLNADGVLSWPRLLTAAAASGSDDTLSISLKGKLKIEVERRKPRGGFSMVAVPYTAAQTLAESQFNMYYMRALARRASTEGLGLTVYRAKIVENPRSSSESMIGSELDPEQVLTALRRTKGVEPEIGIPLPNTGITVKLT